MFTAARTGLHRHFTILPPWHHCVHQTSRASGACRKAMPGNVMFPASTKAECSCGLFLLSPARDPPSCHDGESLAAIQTGAASRAVCALRRASCHPRYVGGLERIFGRLPAAEKCRGGRSSHRGSLPGVFPASVACIIMASDVHLVTTRE